MEGGVILFGDLKVRGRSSVMVAFRREGNMLKRIYDAPDANATNEVYEWLKYIPVEGVVLEDVVNNKSDTAASIKGDNPNRILKFVRLLVKKSSLLKKNSKDEAMRVNLLKGGIDLNPAQMSMVLMPDTLSSSQVKGSDDFKFEFNGQNFDTAQITGMSFTIRSITPVKNLPEILGVSAASLN